MTDLLASVRIATPADEDGIMGLCQMLHEENGLFEMDVERVKRTIRAALCPGTNPDQSLGIIGVIGPIGALQGMIVLKLGSFWYAREDDVHLEEYFAFVHPDHRRSTNAKALVAFAKATSDRLRIPLLIGIISNQRTEAKVRLYERWLPRAGAFFFYKPE